MARQVEKRLRMTVRRGTCKLLTWVLGLERAKVSEFRT
jgi:hypothetical protein